MQPDPQGSGAYIDPPDPATSLPGVPSSLLALVRGPLFIETFYGEHPTATVSPEGYFTVATGGSVFTDANVAPAAGDVTSRGIRRITLNADPVAPKGIAKRCQTVAFGPDGFGAARPTIFASRFRSNGPAPTAATYECVVGGILSFGSSSGPITEGPHIIFDPTLGVVSWVCRATRAGVAAPDVVLATYDNNFHTAGFLHRGTEILPFFDGAVFSPITAAERQPSTTVFPCAHRLLAFAAGGNNADLDIDFVAWGS